MYGGPFFAIVRPFDFLHEHTEPRMSDDNLIPISDEQAKLGQEAIGAARDLGGYLAKILGDLPQDLVGLLAGDRVKAARAERLERLWEESKKRLEDRGVCEPKSPSLKFAIPILEAAADEQSTELQDLWARLLAATMDRNRRDAFRLSFIEIVKKMDPIDALVLQAVFDNGYANWTPSGRDFLRSKLEISQDEVLVSFGNLEKLDCVGFSPTGPKINPIISPLGTLLISTVRG